MTEADIYAGYSIRTLPNGSAVAVFRLQASDGLNGEEEAIFDEASLAIRVRNLQLGGHDSDLSEAALRALRSASDAPDAFSAALSALRPALPRAGDGAEPCFPGLALLREPIERAARMVQDRFEPGPCLLLMTPRSHDGTADCRGEEAIRLAMLGVAERLADNLRRVDRLARLGGTRFGACLPRLAPDDAAALAERMRRAIAYAPFEAPGGPIALWLETEVLPCPADRSLTPEALATAMLAAAESRLRESLAADAAAPARVG